MNESSFSDVTGEVSTTEIFTFSFATIAKLLGADLVDGAYTVHARTLVQDTIQDSFSFSFELDTLKPTLDWDLASESDTGTRGDKETALATVDLIGTTEPNQLVSIAGTELMVTSEEDGAFVFTGLPLAIGENQISITTADAAANVVEATYIVVRRTESSDDSPPVVTAKIANDSGADASDGISNDVTVSGVVSDESPIAKLEFSTTSEFATSVDVTSNLDAQGGYSVSAAQLSDLFGGELPDGSYTVWGRAADSVGNQSDPVRLDFVLDTTPIEVLEGPISSGESTTTLRVSFSEFPSDDALQLFSYTLSVVGDQPVGLTSATRGNGNTILLVADEVLDAQEYDFTVNSASDLAGNQLVEAQTFRFRIQDPTGISQFSPAGGESHVSLTRESIIRFDEPIVPSTVSSETIYAIANGKRLNARLVVSSTNTFATLFFAEPLPASTEVRLVVEGDKIVGQDGLPLDADGDNEPGGTGTADFTTLPVTRIEGTDVWGYVYESNRKDENGDDIPVVGVRVEEKRLFHSRRHASPRFLCACQRALRPDARRLLLSERW